MQIHQRHAHGRLLGLNNTLHIHQFVERNSTAQARILVDGPLADDRTLSTALRAAASDRRVRDFSALLSSAAAAISSSPELQSRLARTVDVSMVSLMSNSREN